MDWQLPIQPAVDLPPLDADESDGGVVGGPTKEDLVVEMDPLNPLAVLNGPPREHFRDNLKEGVQYITSWPDAGWTNDVMTYANLVYLGLITDRVPIIPMFYPSHIGYDVPPIPFRDVFDIDRMRKLIGKPILEWQDLKDPKSEALENLGCWNVWESTLKPPPDVSYTKTPNWVKMFPEWPHDRHSSFWTLARFAFPEDRAQNLGTPLPSPKTQVSLPPDEQLLCYDYLYYVCAQQPFEFEKSYSPAWRFVAKYMYWAPSLQAIADEYIRRTIGVNDNKPIPPYIAIHVRRADFANACTTDFKVPVEDCFAKISTYGRRVDEVKAEILEKKGVHIDHVIMTSDERDEGWWKEVEEQGWSKVDHSMTKERYGDWHPVLIDAVIQSGALGFVGTARSTMSVLAIRRVEDWNGGVARMTQWGTVNADDH
ncbi:hypothetical protein D9758_002236 [Tetrapyrgos nigripes]|uniref:GDP-fucose protein O-fucosyltransferase 2 n=1 Tax=Tetrapyrgos nigripes TaxID=182062 RepID=A0A8H5LT33_9AGAR|nr:hypothetical protein D9758_002236 [Tetrapyrgos nigripes]